jgi:insertion element IS1 protein InsB
MTIRDCCPQCYSIRFKKNGHIHNGKQNHRCKICGRQFVSEFEQHVVSSDKRTLVDRLLGERVSLHGICRVVGVSMKWLMGFAVECYDSAPEDLNARVPQCPKEVIFRCLEVEADDLLSFVGKKTNKQWLWLAMDAGNRQAIAYYVGDRSKDSAKELWAKVPTLYQERATFFTDGYASYQGVFPEARHCIVSKKSRLTNHIERLELHSPPTDIAACAIDLVLFKKACQPHRRHCSSSFAGTIRS